MKKAKKIILLLLATLIFSVIVFFTFNFWSRRLAEVSFVDRHLVILAELAISNKEHKKGLMYRQKMNLKNGMLFVFDEEGERSFWMKNTRIPLDIIFISSDFFVVDIKNNFEPCLLEECPSYKSIALARYVLEISAGLAEKNGLKIGDKAKIKIK